MSLDIFMTFRYSLEFGQKQEILMIPLIFSELRAETGLGVKIVDLLPWIGCCCSGSEETNNLRMRIDDWWTTTTGIWVTNLILRRTVRQLSKVAPVQSK